MSPQKIPYVPLISLHVGLMLFYQCYEEHLFYNVYTPLIQCRHSL